MKEFHFPHWPEHLARAPLNNRLKDDFAITLRWYLSFCRRCRAAVAFDSAREFIAWAQREKHPEPWKVERWKEAIRWFFRQARAAGNQPGAVPPAPKPATPGGKGSPGTTSPVQAGQSPAARAKRQPPAWKTAYLTTIRRRCYSYRTEQSYLVWLERFARFCHSDDLQARGTDDIKAFLDQLALDERLSASSQRQALNALV